MIERGLLRRAKADGTPYRNRGWWFPGALLPGLDQPGRASHWWLAKRRYLVDELGVDGFKTDGGEHAWGDELRYADGTRGDRVQQPLPRALRRGLPSLLDDAEGTVTFSRAGFTGAGARRRATGPATRTRPGRRSAPRSPPG